MTDTYFAADRRLVNLPLDRSSCHAHWACIVQAPAPAADAARPRLRPGGGGGSLASS
ncbi:MAG TPA: hypothetical protein VJ770_15525 [Stellaceae bacterium]|nr:hypothetical protein [Stellaceae bacterium]